MLPVEVGLLTYSEVNRSLPLGQSEFEPAEYQEIGTRTGVQFGQLRLLRFETQGRVQC